MEPTPITKAQQQHLATLAPYLPHGIEVEHRALGRGVLVGLPACHINDHGPLASVEFASLGANYFPDYYLLTAVKPVLYAPEDMAQAITDGPAEVLSAYSRLLGEVLQGQRIHEMAQLVDDLRALGIALNLPAGSYIRKELPNA